MKYLELFSGIKSSIMAFGCASVQGAKSGIISKKAIFTALDNGVNHFDLARSYGYGAAEKFVGRLLESERQNIILASKFGIRATTLSTFLKPLKPLKRSFKRFYNNTSKETQIEKERHIGIGYHDPFHKRIKINSSEMVKSLEESLKALRTDYLDYFFVHEPYSAIQDKDQLFDTADRLKKEGKIRAFGLASDIDLLHLHEQYISNFDIVQFNYNISCPNTKVETNRRYLPNVLFSPLRYASDTMNVKEIFNSLHDRFPLSVFLCSMFDSDHIVENCKIFI